jgi:hypothetical protein
MAPILVSSIDHAAPQVGVRRSFRNQNDTDRILARAPVRSSPEPTGTTDPLEIDR